MSQQQHSGRGARHAERRGERGFTLIETVVAMIVMMTVGLGASALLLYSISNNSASAARAQSLAIAQKEMERLRSVEWSDALLAATANPVTSTVTSGGGAGTGVADSKYSFTVSKTITEQNPVPAPGGGNRMTTKLITISVTPFTNNASWTAGAVTITSTRSTLQRGPY
ncbi:MAG: prepilin-type N-terminal cleavage/methylation domain-containing protein [Pyrinomonadaceae bacterium]